MRLIDADALEDVVYKMNWEWKESAGITRGEFKRIESVIFEFPTAVVRCGECRYHEPNDDESIYCPMIDEVREKNWFCADGERK